MSSEHTRPLQNTSLDPYPPKTTYQTPIRRQSHLNEVIELGPPSMPVLEANRDHSNWFRT
jgi:hypothetical protein